MTSRVFTFVLCFISVVSCTPHDTLRTSSTTSSSSTSSSESASGTAPEKPSLTVMSWNMKHLGRKNQNTAAAAELLKSADIIALQEVNSSQAGQDAIMRLATQLRKLASNDRICVGLSETPSDGRERYGYLWRDSRVAFVKTNGEVVESCPPSSVTIRLEKKNADKIVREPAIGSFYSKPTKTKFVLASIHLVPSGKKPQLEVPPLFESMMTAEGPIIVAGDYNLDSGHSAFNIARKARFRAAFLGVKTSLKSKKRELSKPYDNFWFRDVELKSAAVLNLYQSLTHLPQSEIYNSISDHSPIVGEFAISSDKTAPTVRAPSNL